MAHLNAVDTDHARQKQEMSGMVHKGTKTEPGPSQQKS